MSVMDYDQLVLQLQKRISEEKVPQIRSLAPELAYGRHAGPAPACARESSVLILLFPCSGGLTTILTLRSEHLGTHANQVSFPGGRVEEGESAEEAALREWQEELGPLDAPIHWVGRLPSLYLFHSNYLVIPCVAVTSVPPRLRPNPAEVVRAFDLPIHIIGDPTYRSWHWQYRGTVKFRAPHIAWSGERIWGATAMLCDELYQRIRGCLGDSS